MSDVKNGMIVSYRLLRGIGFYPCSKPDGCYIDINLTLRLMYVTADLLEGFHLYSKEGSRYSHLSVLSISSMEELRDFLQRFGIDFVLPSVDFTRDEDMLLKGAIAATIESVVRGGDDIHADGMLGAIIVNAYNAMTCLNTTHSLYDVEWAVRDDVSKRLLEINKKDEQ